MQVFANDMDDAVAEVRWAADTFDRPFGGILLPSIPPNSHLPPLWEDHYEPLWQVCAELDVPINIHGGSALPDYGEHEAARAMMLIEIPWFSHRSVWHLIFSGVLERHPTLRFAVTEQGVAWLPRGLETLDWFYGRMTTRQRGGGQLLRCRGREDDDEPVGVLRPQLLDRRRPSCARARPRCAATSASTMSCGAPTTRTRRGATPIRPRRCAWRSPTTPSPTCGRWSSRPRRPSTASTSSCCGRSATASARWSPTWPSRFPPEDWPTQTTCNAFDPTQILRAW